MKNKGIIIFVIVIILIIAGVIIFNVTNSTNSKEETLEKANETTEMTISYEGINITPGEEFDKDAIAEEYEYSEIESCAFDGVDKIYTYSNVEITVADVDGVQTVYSVYFLNEEIETTEGVKISDSKDLMIEIYGDDYENNLGKKYDYVEENYTLSFIIDNDYITSIEYILNT